jgi:hypothetical protein
MHPSKQTLVKLLAMTHLYVEYTFSQYGFHRLRKYPCTCQNPHISSAIFFIFFFFSFCLLNLATNGKEGHEDDVETEGNENENVTEVRKRKFEEVE